MQPSHRDMIFVGLLERETVERDIGNECAGDLIFVGDCFPWAFRNASVAADAEIRIDEELVWKLGGAIGRSMLDDSVNRASVDARAVNAVLAQARNYDGHDRASPGIFAVGKVPRVSTVSPRATMKSMSELARALSSRTSVAAACRANATKVFSWRAESRDSGPID